MRYRRTKRLVSALAIAAVALPLVATEAAGHAFVAPSRVTIDYDQGDFHGRVKSDRASCKMQRKVQVWKDVDGPDKFVGDKRTNDNGVWRMSRPDAKGRFYAVVKRRVTGRYAHHHECKKDVSPSRNVG